MQLVAAAIAEICPLAVTAIGADLMVPAVMLPDRSPSIGPILAAAAPASDAYSA